MAEPVQERQHRAVVVVLEALRLVDDLLGVAVRAVLGVAPLPAIGADGRLPVSLGGRLQPRVLGDVTIALVGVLTPVVPLTLMGGSVLLVLLATLLVQPVQYRIGGVDTRGGEEAPLGLQDGHCLDDVGLGDVFERSRRLGVPGIHLPLPLAALPLGASVLGRLARPMGEVLPILAVGIIGEPLGDLLGPLEEAALLLGLLSSARDVGIESLLLLAGLLLGVEGALHLTEGVDDHPLTVALLDVVGGVGGGLLPTGLVLSSVAGGGALVLDADVRRGTAALDLPATPGQLLDLAAAVLAGSGLPRLGVHEVAQRGSHLLGGEASSELLDHSLGEVGGGHQGQAMTELVLAAGLGQERPVRLCPRERDVVSTLGRLDLDLV